MTPAGASGSKGGLRCAVLSALLGLSGCDSTGHGQQRASSPSAPPPAPPERAAAPAAGARSAEVRRLEPCVPLNYEECFNALDDNCNGAIDEGCGTPGGVVQFMIAWDTARADVDLNVMDPNGELIEAGRPSQSGLIKGRDCPGRRQECGGVNLENVFLEGSKAPIRGTYRVNVSLERLGGDEPPIWVNLSARLGAKHYAFEIRLNEPEDEQELELPL